MTAKFYIADRILAVWLGLTPAVSLLATEFPLTLKLMTAQEARSCPGNAGGYARLEVKKPDSAKAEPKAASGHPLYGQLWAGRKPMLFRVDESQGEGKGYDRLVLDLNRNGDLTDGPVSPPSDVA